MATPKEKLDAPEVNKAPEGLWSKFVSFNKNILRKAMSPFKEEITMANNIANDDSKKS